MSELKTLKDCKDKEEARAEAIKWVKYFKEMMRISVGTDIYYFKGRLHEVMERNNLTEEDLKDE